MAVALYMDEHIPHAITLGLRLRQVEVLTAQEDRFDGLPDPALLDRATALGRGCWSPSTMISWMKRLAGRARA